MGFFKTVYTLCTRTSAFPEMLETRVWKALLHSVLLLLLCPLIVASVQTCRAKQECTTVLQHLEQKSGGFGFSGNEMCFGGTFEARHYTFELFDSDMRLDYVTSRETLQKLDPDRWKEQSGLLITKSLALFWTKTPDQSFLFFEIPAELLKTYLTAEKDSELVPELLAITRKANTQQHTAAALLNAAAESLPPVETVQAAGQEKKTENAEAAKPAESASTEKQTASPITAPEKAESFKMQDAGYIRDVLCSLFWGYLFQQYLITGLLMFVLGGLCFALMEFLYLRMMPNKLPFGKVYMLTLYAMFPALIVASLATLTGQTFLSFQTVFLIAFFIYQLFSFKALGLFLNPPDKRQQNNFPDDDDF